MRALAPASMGLGLLAHWSLLIKELYRVLQRGVDLYKPIRACRAPGQSKAFGKEPLIGVYKLWRFKAQGLGRPCGPQCSPGDSGSSPAFPPSEPDEGWRAKGYTVVGCFGV